MGKIRGGFHDMMQGREKLQTRYKDILYSKIKYCCTAQYMYEHALESQNVCMQQSHSRILYFTMVQCVYTLKGTLGPLSVMPLFLFGHHPDPNLCLISLHRRLAFLLFVLLLLPLLPLHVDPEPDREVVD